MFVCLLLCACGANAKSKFKFRSSPTVPILTNANIQCYNSGTQVIMYKALFDVIDSTLIYYIFLESPVAYVRYLPLSVVLSLFLSRALSLSLCSGVCVVILRQKLKHIHIIYTTHMKTRDQTNKGNKMVYFPFWSGNFIIDVNRIHIHIFLLLLLLLLLFFCPNFIHTHKYIII